VVLVFCRLKFQSKYIPARAERTAGFSFEGNCCLLTKGANTHSLSV